MNSEAVDILEKSLKFLSDPDHWAKGVLGRDKNGNAIDYISPHCHSRCLASTVLFFLYKQNKKRPVNSEFHDVAFYIKEAIQYQSIAEVNDHSTHEEILEILRKSIEKAKL